MKKLIAITLIAIINATLVNCFSSIDTFIFWYAGITIPILAGWIIGGVFK